MLETRQGIVVMMHGAAYRVVELTNRLKPEVGTRLQGSAVEEFVRMKHVDIKIIEEEEEEEE
ncbi:hypothetical protein LCGC14_2558660 [marine sediment metagenome]|uniref:Uncharacterized protein n=1 Tax=marine sediment metagenome TaxID=412755 RepID=A0A0F9DDR7_9ZZZZ